MLYGAGVERRSYVEVEKQFGGQECKGTVDDLEYLPSAVRISQTDLTSVCINRYLHELALLINLTTLVV